MTNENISNKTILALVAIALVITVVGTVVSMSKLNGLGGQYTSLTGAATSGTGTTSVTVQGTAAISLGTSAATFPTGYYNASCTSNYSVLSADFNSISSDCWVNLTNWFQTSHAIQNTGTTVINLTVQSNNNGTRQLFCGTGNCPSTQATNSIFAIKAQAGESGACDSGLQNTFANILTTQSNTTVTLCNAFNFDDASDDLNIFFNMTIPKDVAQGVKSTTLTYTATAQ